MLTFVRLKIVLKGNIGNINAVHISFCQLKTTFKGHFIYGNLFNPAPIIRAIDFCRLILLTVFQLLSFNFKARPPKLKDKPLIDLDTNTYRKKKQSYSLECSNRRLVSSVIINPPSSLPDANHQRCQTDQTNSLSRACSRA